MTNYPAKIDTTVSLPTVVDNSTPVSGVTVNRLRDAILAIEDELGVKPSGIYGTVRARLDTIELGVGNLQIIELAGDLGNTLANPYVIGIWGRPISNVVPQLNNVLTWDGIAWIPSPAPSGGSSGFAGGDLSGAYPSPTVVGLRGKSLDASLATLGSVQDGYALTWINATSSWQARSVVDIDILAGDVTGPLATTVVGKINGATIPIAGALITGNVLQVSGSSALSYGPINLAGGSNYVTGVLPTGNQANQTMGGDVTGTTAASTVVALRSKTLSSSLSTIGATQDGYILTWVNSNSDWEAQPPQHSPIIRTGFAPFTTANTTFTNAATFDFDPTTIPTGVNRRIKLIVVAETTTPLMTIQLYNFTSVSIVTGAPLFTTTATSATEFVSFDLTPYLTNGKAIYQVQIKMAAGSPGDQITLDYARLEIDYA